MTTHAFTEGAPLGVILAEDPVTAEVRFPHSPPSFPSPLVFHLLLFVVLYHSCFPPI